VPCQIAQKALSEGAFFTDADQWPRRSEERYRECSLATLRRGVVAHY